MDDMEYLVQETFRLNHVLQTGNSKGFKFEPGKIPTGPGILYHLQDSRSVFVIRTLPSDDLARDHALILQHPEDYPSLKLLEEDGCPEDRLQWFTVETKGQADHVHSRVGQRRFPRREEDVCNLSDPGFSWWTENSKDSFTLYGKMNWMKEGLTRLGPLYDVNLAQPRWAELSSLLVHLPIPIQVTTELSKFQLSADPEHRWLVDEFRRVFIEGVVSEELREIFIILGKRGASASGLESSWYFLQEAAAVRNFWKNIQSQLS